MIKMLFLFLLSTSVWANLHLAPANFDIPEGRAVFVDFTSTHYSLQFDMGKKVLRIVSIIEFENTEEGFPIFDLVAPVDKIFMDDIEIESKEISLPGNTSKVKIALDRVNPGKHKMSISHRLKNDITFNPKSIKMGFWIRDLRDRMFMEQYIPSNLEFDQYKMTMDISIEGNPNKLNQEIYTNGTVTQINWHFWRIEFPSYFTAAAPYLHLTRKGSMYRRDFNYKSISGRDIPVTVYSKFWIRTLNFAKKAKKVLAELENDYGPWAHPTLLAYGAGRGGMEHSGATMTSLAALDHEILHSYFSKGIFPSNGNTGWIDEAIASWRDKGYPSRSTVGFTRSGLASHSPYRRHTDDGAYSLGRDFMGHIDYLLSNTGGLKAFLKGYFAAYKFQMITNDHFINNLEFFSGLNLRPLFEEHIFKTASKKSTPFEANPVHVQLTKAEYLELQ